MLPHPVPDPRETSKTLFFPVLTREKVFALGTRGPLEVSLASVKDHIVLLPKHQLLGPCYTEHGQYPQVTDGFAKQ